MRRIAALLLSLAAAGLSGCIVVPAVGPPRAHVVVPPPVAPAVVVRPGYGYGHGHGHGPYGRGHRWQYGGWH